MERRPRPLSPLREHLRDTFWFAPVVGLVGAAVLAWACGGVDVWIVDVLRGTGDDGLLREAVRFTGDAKGIVSMVGPAMLTFIGVVFSISLVAMQMVSGQWSQRVMRLYVRNRITKGTFSAFLATFVFALLVQTQYDTERDIRYVTAVPVATSAVAVGLVVLSLLLFIAYVNSIMKLMRVSHVLDRIAKEAAGTLGADAEPYEGEPPPPYDRVVSYRGRSGVLRDVHVARLVRIARRHGVVLHLLPRIGDFLVPGTPVFGVSGEARGRLGARGLCAALSAGVERTFHQDLGFGLRQLADIGLRALSPAVNDPTTAVQCVDRIEQFLGTAAARPLGVLLHRDRGGGVRLAQDLPDWASLVDLGFAELRTAAAGNPQVSRRLAAALDDLLRLAPEERARPLRENRRLLERAVLARVHDPDEQRFALEADRQGIG